MFGIATVFGEMPQESSIVSEHFEDVVMSRRYAQVIALARAEENNFSINAHNLSVMFDVLDEVFALYGCLIGCSLNSQRFCL